MLTVALWETGDWHGRHFAPALLPLCEIVNIRLCQTSTTLSCRSEEAALNSPPVSDAFSPLSPPRSSLTCGVQDSVRNKEFKAGMSGYFDAVETSSLRLGSGFTSSPSALMSAPLEPLLRRCSAATRRLLPGRRGAALSHAGLLCVRVVSCAHGLCF